MGGAVKWLKRLIDNVAKLALFLKYYECSFHEIKNKVIEILSHGVKMQSTFA